jgi:hypothetical protein
VRLDARFFLLRRALRLYESAFNVQNATGWSLLLGEAWAALKTILRFDSAELYLVLNKDVSDGVVQKLQAELNKMRSEGFVEDTLNSYL